MPFIRPLRKFAIRPPDVVVDASSESLGTLEGYISNGTLVVGGNDGEMGSAKGQRTFYANPTTGTGPYSYTWTCITGDAGFSISGNTDKQSAAVIHSQITGTAGISDIGVKCRVIDSAGASGTFFGYAQTFMQEDGSPPTFTTLAAEASPATPPSGTAIETRRFDAVSGQFVQWGQAFSAATSSDLADRLFLYKSGSPVEAVQCVDKIYRSGGTLLWARLVAHMPNGATAGENITLFESATESIPSVPASFDFTSGNTVSVQFDDYLSDVWCVTVPENGTYNVGDVIAIKIDDGVAAETYQAKYMTGNSFQNGTNHMQNLSQQIQGQSTRWRTRKWGSAEIGTDYTYTRFGGTWNETGKHRILIFQKRLGSGVEPTSFTVTTAASNTQAGMVITKVRSKQARATNTATLAGATYVRTVFSGHQARQDMFMKHVGNGLRVFFYVTDTRRGDRLNDIRVKNTDSWTTTIRDWHYDLSISVNSIVQYSAADVYQAPKTLWRWPFVPRRISLGQHSYWKGTDILPTLREYGSFSQSDENETYIGYDGEYSQYWGAQVPWSHIGQPCHFGFWDPGLGSAGAGNYYGWMNGWEAFIWRHWRLSSLAKCATLMGNPLGASTMHWNDENETGAKKYGVLLPYRTDAQRVGSCGAVMYGYNDPPGSFDFTGYPNQGSVFKSLINHGGSYFKSSHGASKGWLMWLLTGDDFFHEVMEHNLSQFAYRIADAALYYTTSDSNSAYSTTNAVYRTSFSNGSRGRYGAWTQAWQTATYTPSAAGGYSAWSTLAANLIAEASSLVNFRPNMGWPFQNHVDENTFAITSAFVTSQENSTSDAYDAGWHAGKDLPTAFVMAQAGRSEYSALAMAMGKMGGWLTPFPVSEKHRAHTARGTPYKPSQATGNIFSAWSQCRLEMASAKVGGLWADYDTITTADAQIEPNENYFGMFTNLMGAIYQCSACVDADRQEASAAIEYAMGNIWSAHSRNWSLHYQIAGPK